MTGWSKCCAALLPDFDKGILGCDFCEDVVTRSSLFAIYPDDGFAKFVCKRPVCIRRFALFVQRAGLA